MQKIFQRARNTVTIKSKEVLRTVSLLVSLVCFTPKRSLLKKNQVVLSLYACKTGD